MKCEIEIISLHSGVAYFDQFQGLNHFIYANNCKKGAYCVKNSPNYVAWFSSPDYQLRVSISRKFCHKKTPASDHEYSVT
jgi:hypothetical protein